MHPDDAKLSKSIRILLAIKEPAEAKNEREALLSSLDHWSETKDALRALLQHTSELDSEEQEKPAREGRLTHYQSLLTAGLNETTGVLLADDQEVLMSLGPTDFGIFACRESVIPEWIKAQADREEPKTPKELQGELFSAALEEPDEAVQCALASWACRAMEPRTLRKLIPLVAADFNSETRQGLLEQVMLRDRDGDFTIRWLKEKPELASQTSERILFSPRLMQHALNSAPKWFRHPSAEPLVEIFKDWVSGLPGSTRKHRAELSGRLLTLAGALVPVADRSAAANKLLSELQTIGLQVWKSAADTENQHQTWTFIQSGTSLEADDKVELNSDQAKQLSLALLRARKGKDALTELESACVNLGASRFGEIGQVVTYDATIHNDLEGGLLPDDSVTIVKSGIKFPNGATVKADVRLNPDS